MATVEQPLIVIVGPTASGKSALAIELAEQFRGEIICADSRTVYRGMDIGTAKPSLEDQATVPHWGLDLVDPDESFTAADFKKYAVQKIAEIRARGNVPFLVGGTGLYVDGVIFDYQFTPADPARRAELEGLTLEQLHEYCNENNIELPENENNKRYVIRAIEQNGTTPARLLEPQPGTIIVGITTESDELQRRIERRTEQLFDHGVVQEATELADEFGWESEAMTGNIYRLSREYLDGSIDLEALKEKFVIADRQLAKRQLTWLRRNPHIVWLELPKARQYLADKLAGFVQA